MKALWSSIIDYFTLNCTHWYNHHACSCTHTYNHHACNCTHWYNHHACNCTHWYNHHACNCTHRYNHHACNCLDYVKTCFWPGLRLCLIINFNYINNLKIYIFSFIFRTTLINNILIKSCNKSVWTWVIMKIIQPNWGTLSMCVQDIIEKSIV